jgi:hypothetical protein
MPENPECLEECFVGCQAGMMHVYVYADGKHYGYSVRNRKGDQQSVGASSLPGEELPLEEAKKRAEVQARRSCTDENLTFKWMKCPSAQSSAI